MATDYIVKQNFEGVFIQTFPAHMHPCDIHVISSAKSLYQLFAEIIVGVNQYVNSYSV